MKKEISKDLLAKGKQSFFRMIFSRTGLILVLLAIQVLFFLSIFICFEEFIPHIYGIVIFFTLFMVLYLLNSSMNPTAKITWLVVILFMPVFGVLLYLYTQTEIGHRTLKNRTNQIITESKAVLTQDEDVYQALKKEKPGIASLANYLSRSGCHPVWNNTDVQYFSLGEYMFEEMLVQLEQAKSFIFMEYFIVADGLMWGKLVDVLSRKAQEGVEVRFLYDGTNEFTTLSHDYPSRLAMLGIHCKSFAPVTPFISTHYNYRDHRKILVIDGQTAFNGGINLADEYINEVVHYGHWKDTGVMIKGDAVQSFTMMFLQMWNLDEAQPIYEPFVHVPLHKDPSRKGFVMPYGDCPVDDDKVGEHVYIDLLNRAHEEVFIMSPYLILDGEMEDALKFAAKRGVDVQIILPGISDSKIAHGLAYTHYRALLEAGVKIFEYTPGYVHAKMFIVDRQEAVVGTINLDYRSLYHHFECATYMYQTACISDILKDYFETENKCLAVTLDALSSIPLKRKLMGFVAKTVAPLI